jgi:cardiolipin synthase A/B
MTKLNRALARILVAGVAVSSLAGGCTFDRTLAVPRPDTTLQLIQEPDAGYQPIIDLIRSANRPCG